MQAHSTLLFSLGWGQHNFLSLTKVQVLPNLTPFLGFDLIWGQILEFLYLVVYKYITLYLYLYFYSLKSQVFVFVIEILVELDAQ